MYTEILVYPNPFDYFINIEMTCPEKSNFVILLADIKGSKLTRIMGADLNKGTNRIPLIGLHSLPIGDYRLTIRSNEGELIYETILVKG